MATRRIAQLPISCAQGFVPNQCFESRKATHWLPFATVLTAAVAVEFGDSQPTKNSLATIHPIERPLPGHGFAAAAGACIVALSIGQIAIWIHLGDVLGTATSAT